MCNSSDCGYDQASLSDYVHVSGVSVLNADASTSGQSLFAASGDGALKSNADVRARAQAADSLLICPQTDSQLLLCIPFKEKVKIRGIRFTAAEGDNKASGELVRSQQQPTACLQVQRLSSCLSTRRISVTLMMRVQNLPRIRWCSTPGDNRAHSPYSPALGQRSQRQRSESEGSEVPKRQRRHCTQATDSRAQLPCRCSLRTIKAARTSLCLTRLNSSARPLLLSPLPLLLKLTTRQLQSRSCPLASLSCLRAALSCQRWTSARSTRCC